MMVLGVRRADGTFLVEEVVDRDPGKDARVPGTSMARVKRDGRAYLPVLWRSATECRRPRVGDVLVVAPGGGHAVAIPPPPDDP